MRLIGVEAAGEGILSGHHSATLSAGVPGVLHGSLSYLLQDADGQVAPAHSVSAGLDYPGVGPEHSYLRDTGRVSYESATDAEALDAFQAVCRLEGIIPGARDRARLRLCAPHGRALARGRAGAGLPQRPRRQGRRPRGDLLGSARVTSGPVPTDILPASQVAELINGLVKALRAYHMYLPNNPIYQRASDNLRIAFQPIWAVLDELVLTVAETDFIWEEQVVYHQLNKAESIAWGLFKDGMRSLTIRRGAELEELPRFLETINRARFLPTDAGDDLLTLLWEQEFEFIQYNFIEFFGDSGAALPEQTGSYAASGQEAEAAARDRKAAAAEEAPPRPKGVIDLEEFDSTLYFLEEKRDQPGGRGGRGRVPPGRAHGGAQHPVRSLRDPGRGSRCAARSSACSSRCSPICSTRAISGPRPPCSASAACSRKRASRASRPPRPPRLDGVRRAS